MSADRTAAREKLEQAVDLLVDDYIRLINIGSPDPSADPKGYSNFHGSGKLTLSHLDYLLKMLRISADGDASDETADLVAQALKGMGAPPEEAEDDA